MMLYIHAKFHEEICKGFKVIERTRNEILPFELWRSTSQLKVKVTGYILFLFPLLNGYEQAVLNECFEFTKKRADYFENV